MSENNDIHMTRLAGWMLNTLGKAIAVAMGVAIVFAVIAVAADAPALAWFSGLGGTLAFAIVLYAASAPMPPE